MQFLFYAFIHSTLQAPLYIPTPIQKAREKIVSILSRNKTGEDILALFEREKGKFQENDSNI